METVAAADGYTTTLPTTTVKKEKHKKLSIDDYLGYIDDPTFDLTADQFRQILSMHGWTKSQAQKNVLVDMVETMELMDLHRSTLLDGVVSGDAEITLEEAISDFKNLDWEECHVSSLLTKRLIAPAAAAAAEGRPISAKRKTPITFGRKKKKAEVAVHDSAVSGGTTVAAEGTTASAKRKARTTFGKKKKAEVAVDDSPVSAGTTADAGGTTASAKRKARITFGKKKAVDCSAVSAGTTVAAGGTTVSAEGKTPKMLEKVRVDDSPFSGGTAVAAGGTTFTLRRKRPKTLEKEKATEVPVDDSAVATGTTAAAGSTTDGLGGTVPVKRIRSERSGEKAIQVGGVSYSAIPAVLLLMRTVPPKRDRNEDD